MRLAQTNRVGGVSVTLQTAEAVKPARPPDATAEKRAGRGSCGKTVEKGLLIVHTGAGKGKSTAAFGLLLRMLGHGRKGRSIYSTKK